MTRYKITVLCDSNLEPHRLEGAIEYSEQLSVVATGITVKAESQEAVYDEPVELPSEKIGLVTYAGGLRQVIGHAQIVGDEVVARIPLSALELGVLRAIRSDAAKGYSIRKPEIHFKPPQLVTGVMFPTDLRFQITDTGAYQPDGNGE